MLNKTPPHSSEAERATLGAMLLERDARTKAADILKAEAFYEDRHREVFSAALQLDNASKPVDLVSLSEELRGRGKLDEVGGTAYLAKLLDVVPSAANVEHYAGIVQEKWLRRQVIAASRRNMADAFADALSGDELLTTAQERLFGIKQARLEGLEHWGNGLVDELELLYRTRGTNEVSGVPTGLKDLDEALGGLQNEDLIILAARPSMGKTGLALSMARKIAENGKKVAVFSLEMSKKQLYQRWISAECSIDLHRLRNRALSEAEWERAFRLSTHLACLPMYIDDTARLTSGEIRSKARRLKTEQGLDAVLIDYLGLTGDTPHKQWSKSDHVGQVASNIKQMARELKVPIILLSQLNRGCEDRTPPRPMLSDLRDSGNIEEHADVVMLLYRDEYYNPESDAKGIAEVIIAKQRNGPTGTVHLQFTKEFARFGSLAQKYAPPPPRARRQRRKPYPDEED